MNKNTVYILQKDLPHVKAGTEFSQENNNPDYYNANFCHYHDRLHKSRIINNPTWFKPKEEVNESKPTEPPILNFNDNDKKIFSYSDVWEIINSCSKQITIDNKGYLHSLFYTEACKQSKSKKEEPQWEILAYNNPNVFTDVLGGNIVDAKGSGANYAILKNFPIHSVKRFPDNAVWSVGQLTEHGKISAFRITGGIMHVELIDSKYPLTFLYLSQLEAPKEEQVPIKVEIMEFGYGKPQENKGNFYVANFNLPNNAKLPTEKYQSIKSAIEDVLNEDKIKHEKLLSKIESKVRLANMINTQANYLKETLDYINSLK